MWAVMRWARTTAGPTAPIAAIMGAYPRPRRAGEVTTRAEAPCLEAQVMFAVALAAPAPLTAGEDMQR